MKITGDKNVIREDVVKVSYDIDGTGIKSLSEQVKSLGSGTEESLGKANKSVKSFGNSSKAASSGVRSLGGNVKSLSESLQNAGKHVEKIGKGLSSLGGKMTVGLTTPILGVGTASVKFATDASTSFAKVQTIADSTKMSYSQLTNGVTKASTQTGVAITDLNEALYQSISAGVDTGKSIGFTTNMVKLAKGGFTTTESAVDVVTSALNAYGMSADQATAVSDKLITTQNIGKTTVDLLSGSLGMVIPTAKAFGVNLDTVCAGMADLTKNGIQTAEATTYMNAMFNELGKSGTVADKALRKVTGEGFTQLLGKGKSVTDVLAILQNSAKKSGKSLADMFGTAEGGKAALTIMKDGGTEFNGIVKSMASSAGATEAAFKKMDATPAARFQKELNKLKNTAIDTGTKLLPIVTKGLGEADKLLDKLNQLSTDQKEFLIKAAAGVAIAGPAVKGIGSVTGVISKLLTVLGKKSAGTAASQVAKTLGKDVPEGAATTAKGLGIASKAGGMLSTVFAAIPLPAKIALGVGAAAAIGLGVAVKKAHDDAVQADLAKRFGDITLSAEECEDAAKKLTNTPWTIKLNGVSEAKTQLDGLKQSVDSAATAMQKTEWKANTGISLSDEDKSGLKNSAESLSQNALGYLDQKHYTANLAVDAVMQPGSHSSEQLSKSTSAYYGKARSQVEQLNKDMDATIANALKDGKLSSDESAEIEAIQTSIQGMINASSEKEYTAKLKNFQVKATTGGLTAASFKELTNQIGKQTQTSLDKAKQSYDLVVSNLNMQLVDGAISKHDYDNLMKDAQDSMNQRKTTLELKNYGITMGPLDKKYKSETEKISKSASGVFTSKAFEDFGIGKINLKGFDTAVSNQLTDGFNSIDSATRDGLKQCLDAAKPETKQLAELENSYSAAGKVPPKALMDSLQGTFKKEVASGDLTHKWDLLAGQVNQSSSLKTKLGDMAKLGTEIPKELADALKSEYGLVYEAGKGLVQQANPEPSLVESVKKSLHTAGIDISDAMAQSLSDKGADVTTQVEVFGNKLKTGGRLKAAELKTLYTDLGLTTSTAFVNGLSKKSTAIQSSATTMVTKLLSATDAQRPALVADMAKLGGSGAESLLASYDMKLTGDGRLVYAAGEKAGQMVSTMDATTASAILQSPQMGKILNDISVAKEAVNEMNGVTGNFTLKAPNMSKITGVVGTVERAWSEMQAYCNANPLHQTEIVSYYTSHAKITRDSSGKRMRSPAMFNAVGGIVGHKSLSWVAEEGWPESIISFNPAHRARSINLWETTGRALGIVPQKHAAGGIVEPSGTDLLSYTPKESGAARAYNDNSTYAPQFSASFGSNTASDRELERKVKTWVSEAIQDAIGSRDRREPAMLEV